MLKPFIFALAEALKEGFPINRTHATALDVIIAAIEPIARFRYFREIPGQRVFHEIVGRATAPGGEFGKAQFRVWSEMHFHDRQFRGGRAVLSKQGARRPWASLIKATLFP
ncbi:MAG: hypothetical protein KGM15_14390, partial [Pseudomonadota bacterium]|nr:hypothetical protein [Pseudomonadota bacterium]